MTKSKKTKTHKKIDGQFWQMNKTFSNLKMKQKNKITAVNAGHEYPMLKQGDGEYKILEDPHGFVMAVMRDIEHESYELKLQKGDSIFIYTDGAPDATDAKGEQFERQRLLDSLNKQCDRTPQEIVVHVREDIDNFVGTAEQFDDITLLCFTYHGNSQ